MCQRDQSLCVCVGSVFKRKHLKQRYRPKDRNQISVGGPRGSSYKPLGDIDLACPWLISTTDVQYISPPFHHALIIFYSHLPQGQQGERGSPGLPGLKGEQVSACQS